MHNSRKFLLFVFVIFVWLGVSAKTKIATAQQPPTKYKLETIDVSTVTSTNSAPAIADDDIPIGAVMEWWRPSETSTLPAGFMICDGSQVTAANSPIQGLTLPDLTDRFVRGVTNPLTIPATGYLTGGNDQHTHAYEFDRHSHAIPHTHDDVIGTTGPDIALAADVGFGGFTSVINLAYHDHVHSYTVSINQYNGNTYENRIQINTPLSTNFPEYIGLLKLCWVGGDITVGGYEISLPLVIK